MTVDKNHGASKPAPTIALKRILLPTDFSPYSRCAVPYAISLARQYGSRVYVHYVLEQFISPTDILAAEVDMDDLLSKIEAGAQKKLSDFARSELPADVDREEIFQTGKAFSRIIQTAREHDIDLIVIATHGATGLSHALFGSTAEKVVRKSPCPVLSVKHTEHDFVLP